MPTHLAPRLLGQPIPRVLVGTGTRAQYRHSSEPVSESRPKAYDSVAEASFFGFCGSVEPQGASAEFQNTVCSQSLE